MDATCSPILSEQPATGMHEAAEEDAVRQRKRQQLGSLLVVLVVVLYVGSSVMIQVLFDELRYEKP
jgi:hypothetical protein